MADTKWMIDPAHSEIGFKIQHLMISTVTGHFRQFALTAIVEGNEFSKVKEVLLTILVDSIDTNNTKRDTHLKSPDFFDSEKYRQITFRTTKTQDVQNKDELTGDLTIKEITKPVTLLVRMGGIAVDTDGKTKAGFTVKTKINRKEFGLQWGAVTETGGVIVGDIVMINAELQLIRE